MEVSSINGKLQVSKASEAECTLTIQGLTTLVAGNRDPHDLILRDWGDPNPTLQSNQRGLFPVMSPFVHEIF